jgi:hypothetical protein
MKKFLAILLGGMVLFLAACGNDSKTNEANGEEKKDQTSEETSENLEAEIDMETLIDQVAMDATIDTSNDTATFDFSLENAGEDPVILGFSSSQKYEIQVTNENGENVYTFSADKMFTQQLTTEELGQGDVFEAKETWTGIKKTGNYEATMTFLVNTINDQPIEANPFQVTQSFTVEEDGSQEGNQENKEEPTSEHEGDGQAFRDITVTGENGNYVVKGEARVFEGNFMYSVEDGHNIHIEPTPFQVDEGAPSWSTFELSIEIPEEDLPQFGTLTLTLFEESSKDGSATNVNYIPLENFQPEE